MPRPRPETGPKPLQRPSLLGARFWAQDQYDESCAVRLAMPADPFLRPRRPQCGPDVPRSEPRPRLRSVGRTFLRGAKGISGVHVEQSWFLFKTLRRMAGETQGSGTFGCSRPKAQDRTARGDTQKR